MLKILFFKCHRFNSYIILFLSISRDDIITGTHTDIYGPSNDVRWHTKWECDILSRISKVSGSVKTQSFDDNDSIGGHECSSNTSALDENKNPVKITSNTTESLYNIVFPLRFIALKRRNPNMYKQLLELESHLEERELQVK